MRPARLEVWLESRLTQLVETPEGVLRQPPTKRAVPRRLDDDRGERPARLRLLERELDVEPLAGEMPGRELGRADLQHDERPGVVRLAHQARPLVAVHHPARAGREPAPVGRDALDP